MLIAARQLTEDGRMVSLSYLNRRFEFSQHAHGSPASSVRACVRAQAAPFSEQCRLHQVLSGSLAVTSWRILSGKTSRSDEHLPSIPSRLQQPRQRGGGGGIRGFSFLILPTAHAWMDRVATRNYTHARRLQQPPARSGNWCFPSQIFWWKHEDENDLLVTVQSASPLNSFIKPFHLSAGGKWEQRVIKPLSCFTTKRGLLEAKAFSFDDLSANLGYFSAELTSHRHPDTRQVQVERERSAPR